MYALLILVQNETNCLLNNRSNRVPPHCKQSIEETLEENLCGVVRLVCLQVLRNDRWSRAASPSVAMQTCYLEATGEVERHNHKNTCRRTYTQTHRETGRQFHLRRQELSHPLFQSETVTQPGHVNKTGKLKTFEWGASYAGSTYSNCGDGQVQPVRCELSLSTKCI